MKIREILMKEVDNHSHGESTTFQEYRNNREKVFEKAKLSLYNNVKDSLLSYYNMLFVSLPLQSKNGISQVIVKCNESHVKHPIRMLDKIYNNGGFKLENYNVPMLPCNIIMDHSSINQCLR
jgi:hypothetical protein